MWCPLLDDGHQSSNTDLNPSQGYYKPVIKPEVNVVCMYNAKIRNWHNWERLIH